jgi:hypothetical protein
MSSPALKSLGRLTEGPREVPRNVDKIIEGGGWMAYEERPCRNLRFSVEGDETNETTEFIMVAVVVDEAFRIFRPI